MTIISVISIWFTLNTENITFICILGDFYLKLCFLFIFLEYKMVSKMVSKMAVNFKFVAKMLLKLIS